MAVRSSTLRVRAPNNDELATPPGRASSCASRRVHASNGRRASTCNGSARDSVLTSPIARAAPCAARPARRWFPRGTPTSLALVCLSAALYAATFPPLSLAPLAWVALTPFFAALARTSPARAALLGCLWGVGIAYGVGWWFPGMVSGYFQGPPILGWIAFFAVAIGLSGSYYALFGAWLASRARRGAAGPLIVAAGWGACEFARARLLVGNPWALAGYSQVRFAPFMQIADVTGPYGVGMLLAGANAAIAATCVPALRGRRPLRSTLVLAGLVALVLAYGQWRLDRPFGEGRALRVALVQGAVPTRFRWQPELRAANVRRYLALTDEAAATEPELIVWPENAIEFYLQDRIPESEAVMARSRTLRADLLVDGPRYSFDDDRTIYHNSVFLVRAGHIAARHDKLHLLPVAEGTGPGGLFARDTSYTPGRVVDVLHTATARVGTFVCLEAMYPELVRGFANVGAELLVNVSNDAWFGAGPAAEHHLDIASVRAIENRRFLLRATSTGYSAVIDPHGQIVARSGLDEPAVLSELVRVSHTVTPYQRVGDLAAWLAVVTALGWWAVRRIRCKGSAAEILTPDSPTARTPRAATRLPARLAATACEDAGIYSRERRFTPRGGG
jgi:apolipoprotein N-acyltransferase